MLAFTRFSLAEVGYPWLGSVASCMCALLCNAEYFLFGLDYCKA